MRSDPARVLGLYLHVPFCAARCGYCDFNTYVPGGAHDPAAFLDAALCEIRLARRALGSRTVTSVFIGGGTPTLLGAEGLLRLLAGVRESFLVAPGAEITTEANPESCDRHLLEALHRGGFTRVSVGMQSSVPHVLAALERVHTPERAIAARAAREAGIEHISLDLIYGTPGESDADWRASLKAALSAEPDHVSAYALTVEPGTRLAAQVRRGVVGTPSDQDAARRFHIAEDCLSSAGFAWYEISSWARTEASRCQHNLGYWRSHDWWGVGPGAHSHVDGVRWSNLLSPAAYAARLSSGALPVARAEILSAEERALEAVMLGLRTRDGVAEATIGPGAHPAVEREVAGGRLERSAGRLRLTHNERLFADAVVRELIA